MLYLALTGKEIMITKIYLFLFVIVLPIFLTGCQIGNAWNMGV